MTRLNVLITGLGGPLGMSVFKALLLSSLPTRIIGTDIGPRSFGLFLADKAHILPHVEREPEAYLDSLLNLIERENLHAIFPCSEGELLLLARNLDRFQGSGCYVAVGPSSVLERVMDKYLLALDLCAAGFPTPASTVPGAKDFEWFVERHGFPLILKARFDSGSRHLYRIQNHEELDFFSRYVKKPVIQELLLPDDEEYTVGVFVAPENRGEGTIILKRQLAAGLTYKAEIIRNEVIGKTCLEVVKHLGLIGANNVQLRLTADGPKVFEINPRFSSTTVIRAFFGFNEPELTLRAMVLGEKVTPDHCQAGIALRMWDELYVDPGVVSRLESEGEGVDLDFMNGISPESIRHRRAHHED